MTTPHVAGVVALHARERRRVLQRDPWPAGHRCPGGKITGNPSRTSNLLLNQRSL